MKKIIYSLLIVSLFITTIHAQSSISGEIRIENNKPASGAILRLMKLDSITMKKFTAANEFGKWHINVESGQYILNIKYLGYKDYYQKIRISQKDSLQTTILLEPNILLLSGVEVVSDAIGITRYGDTLKFNIEHFKSGTEYSLGDMLNQLPGITVNESGTIMHNGKMIDKLLIEGKDILDGKHKLATDGIRVDQLSGIHIIKNYRDENELNTEKSEEIALNIKIKKSEQGKWSGQVTLLGGYQNKFESNISIMNISKKFGVTIFSKSNNSGEKILSFMDYFSIRGGTVKIMQYQDLDDALPKGFNLSPQTNKNIDGIIASSLEYKINKKSKLKGSILAASINREEALSFKEIFGNQKDSKDGNSLNKLNHSILSARVRFLFKFSPKLSTKFIVFGNWEFNKQKEHSDGFFNRNNFSFNNDKSSNKSEIIPSININYKPNKKLSFLLNASYSIKQIQSIFDISDVTPFLNFSINPINNIYSTQQIKDIRLKKFNNEFNIKYHLHKGWSFKINSDTEVNSLLKTYQLSINDPDYLGKITINQNFHKTNLSIVLDSTNWKIKTGVEIFKNEIQLENEISSHPFNVRPRFHIQYNFHEEHNIIAGVNMGIKGVKPGFGSPVLEIIDTRQTQSYNGDWQNLSYSESYILTYSNLRITSGRIIHGFINYIIMKNQMGTNLISFPTYNQLNFVRIPIQKTLRSSINIRFKLPNTNLLLHSTYKGMQDKGKSVFENTFSDYKLNSNTIIIKISSKWKQPFNYGVGYIISHSNQQNGESSAITFYSHTPTIKLSYKFKNGLIWKNNLSHQTSKGLITAFRNWRLDTDINYKIKNKSFSFFIKGRNLTNLTPKKQLSYKFSTYSYSETSYFSFPGYILAGFSWQF